MSSFFSDDEDDSLPLRAVPRPSHNQHRNRDRDSLPAHASSSRGDSLSSPGRNSFYHQFNDTDYERDSSTAPGDESLPSGPRRYALGTQEMDDDDSNAEGGMDLDLGRDLGDLQPFLFEDDNDIKKLIRAWTRERGTRDLMSWEEDVVEDCLHKIGQQNKIITLLKTDSRTSEEEHFKLQMVTMEIERVKFLIRSYLRCRLDKVERYSAHILKTPSLQSKLSASELHHARGYTRILHQHFDASVLGGLPEWLRGKEDVSNEGLSMVRQPNKDIPVLIYVLKDCGEVTLSDGDRAALEPETTHLIRYGLVERFVQLGWVEVF